MIENPKIGMKLRCLCSNPNHRNLSSTIIGISECGTKLKVSTPGYLDAVISPDNQFMEEIKDV